MRSAGAGRNLNRNRSRTLVIKSYSTRLFEAGTRRPRTIRITSTMVSRRNWTLPNLSDGFVQGDSRCGGQVEAALLGRLGNANGAIAVLCDQRFWKAFGFAAEDEAIVRCKLCIPETSRSFGCEEPE